jgi:hypothetical protein
MNIMTMLSTCKAMRLAVGLLLGALAAPSLSMAANHYVRAGATGNGSGSDWTNAYTDLPSSLVRGDTYYFAAGNYIPNGHVFNDPGTTVITLKTATPSDHGTSTGWSDSYAGQVVFGGGSYAPGILDFKAGGYVIDGAYRSGWESGYGMRIALPPMSAIPQGAALRDVWIEGLTGVNIDNITIEYLDMPGYGHGVSQSFYQYGFYAMGWDPGQGGTFSNITLDHCYVHDLGAYATTMLTGQITNFLIQYTEVARNTSVPDFHSEGISDRGSSNVTIRYNRYINIQGTGFIVMNNAGTPQYCNNWQIYGNVMWEKDYSTYLVGMGAVACINYNHCTNYFVYNNTIVNVGWNQNQGGVDFYEAATDSSNINVENNIWYNSINVSPVQPYQGGTPINSDYNFYISSTGVPSESHVQTGTSNIFQDSANGDFHLVTETSDGLHLSSPYNYDPDGVLRGSDNNIWSRGAYQFAPNSSSPNPPANLAVSVH